MKTRPMDNLVRRMRAGLIALYCTIAAPLAHAGAPRKWARATLRQLMFGLTALLPISAVFAATQSINFPAFETREYGYGSVTLGATSSTGLQVRYKSLTPATCVVPPPHEGYFSRVPAYVALVQSGTCTIEALQDGDYATEAAPPVRRSLSIKPRNSRLSACLAASPSVCLPGQSLPLAADILVEPKTYFIPAQFANASEINLTVSTQTNGEPDGFQPIADVRSLTSEVCTIGRGTYIFGVRPGGIAFAGVKFTGVPGTCTIKASLEERCRSLRVQFSRCGHKHHVRKRSDGGIRRAVKS